MCLLKSILYKTYRRFCPQLCYFSSLTHRQKVKGSRLFFGSCVGHQAAGVRREVGFFAQSSALSPQHCLFWLIASLLALCAMPSPAAHATQLTLGWDPPAGSVAGYKIHYGTTSGNYEYSVDVGNYDSCTISGLLEGQTYYFAATSYNVDGIDSDFSEELVSTIPAAEALPTTTGGGQGTKITTFSSEADATAIISRPAQNYGSRSYLEVDASAMKISYLRFNVSGLSGTVVSARIQLECTNASSFGGTIYDISDSSWQEHTVTWDNQPSIDGPALDVLGSVSVGDIVELDVTAVVTGNGTYNFAMDSNNNNGADYYSREGLNSPLLIITTVAAEDATANKSAAPTDTAIDEAHILIEAEDAEINYPFEYGWDAEASSGQFVWVPNGTGNNRDPYNNAGYAKFVFEVPSTGDYVIWGCVLAESRRDNSFYVTVDDDPYAQWNTKRSKSWVWDAVSSKSGADPVIYHLEAGFHVLTIKQLEDGTKIDKILISSDLGYVPE